MNFLRALTTATQIDTEDVRLFRPHGPEFVIDSLGQMRLTSDCLYVGDILDMDDWQAEAVSSIPCANMRDLDKIMRG